MQTMTGGATVRWEISALIWLFLAATPSLIMLGIEFYVSKVE